MTLVVDASVVAAALVDSGPAGRWAEEVLRSDRLVAPQHMAVEVANVLRRAELAGRVSPDVAVMAHRDLVDLPVDLYPYEPFAGRVWELRGSITAYDAWYVALAEAIDGTLATLDLRLATAPGPACPIITP